MSRRSNRLCVCGKTGYQSRDKARDAHGASGDRLRFYACPKSGLWHSTNDEKHRKRETRGSKIKRARRRQRNRTSRRLVRAELRDSR